MDERILEVVLAGTGAVLAPKIYDDVFHPIAEQAGITVENAVSTLILNPVNNCLASLQNRAPKIFGRLEKDVPEKDRCQAAPNITLPTLQGLALNADETLLGEMFYTILKSSVDKKMQEFLSPAFPQILGQLTRDECVILLLLEQNAQIGIKKSFDIPVCGHILEIDESKLNFPKNMPLYTNHLTCLNLAATWGGPYILTSFGKQFCKVCISEKCKDFVN